MALTACGSSGGGFGAAGSDTGTGSKVNGASAGKVDGAASSQASSGDAASQTPGHDATMTDARATDAGKDDSSTKPGKDGAAPGHDSTVPGQDSATPGHDSATPGQDAGPVDASAGDTAPPPVTPCDLCTTAGGQCSDAGVCTVVENLGGVSSSTISSLRGGGSADSSLAWLYPYDKTVFPRGIPSPTLQFSGTAPSAVWVHIELSTMSYDGYFGASSAPLGGGQVTLSAPAWTAVTEMATASGTVQVSLTKMSGGKVSGPITESWLVAPGEARGTIYYETYGSAIAGGLGGVGVMRITPGATKPVAIESGCGNVCHTASANGSTLVASTGMMGINSASYNLKADAAVIHKASNEMYSYGGLFPDGTFEMSATNFRTWMMLPSRLYDTSTGAKLSAPGWDGVITNAGTAAFSPDGTQIAFNHNDKDNGAGHTLSHALFDASTRTFSSIVDMTTDSAHTLAWPSFTPDSATIVYHSATTVPLPDGGTTSGYETDNGNSGDLYAIDVATQTPLRLGVADGYTSAGGTYLPASDPGLNFAPTVLPEAVGGYFWVVFTSHRSYGNTRASKDNNDQNGKLWVAAMDIGASPGQDGSHPAFLLSGQELTSDNLRGFWVLDPCQADGSPCTGGDQCCAGYCRVVSGQFQCVAAPGGCANDYEKCDTSSDCCHARDRCINHLCAPMN